MSSVSSVAGTGSAHLNRSLDSCTVGQQGVPCQAGVTEQQNLLIGDVQDNAPLPVARLTQGLCLAGLSQGEDLADRSDHGARLDQIRDAPEQVGRGLPVDTARPPPMAPGGLL